MSSVCASIISVNQTYLQQSSVSVDSRKMEHFAVKEFGENYVAMYAKGRDLHILKSPHKRVYSPLFSHSCSHHIVCCSVGELRINSQEPNITDKENTRENLNVAVGLSDGSILLLTIHWDTVNVQNVISLNECVGALYCGAGYLLASSISGKCAALYALRNLGINNELPWIRLEIDFAPPITSNRPRRTLGSIPSVIASFSISNKAYTVDTKEQRDLLTSYFDASSAGLLLSTSTTAAAAAEDRESTPESELLLIGCTDGTLWWLQTPHRSTVLDLYGSDSNGNENETPSLMPRLLHTCHTSIQRVLFTGISLNLENQKIILCSSDDSIRSICIVECNGKVTLLGMENEYKKSSWTFQFPAYINVATIAYYKGLFLCINDHSGMLCAITVDSTVPALSKSNSVPVCYAANVSEHILTPKTSPRILSFSIISTSSVHNADGDVLILHTQDAIIHLPLQCSDSPTQCTAMDVICMIQHACGGGSLRHPYTLAPIQVYCSGGAQPDSLIDTITPVTTDDATGTIELDQLELLASQLYEVGEENENTLQQSLQADLEILQLTALLQELPVTLKAECGDKLSTTNGGSDNNVILCNPTRSIEVRYRFRTEPAPNSHTSTSISSSDVCTYMDITINAHSVQAMRALQGRAMTISVHSTFNSTSLHCSADTSCVQVIMQPVLRHSSERTVDKDASEYEYTVTILVNHLSQLSSYRFVLTMVVEAPRNIHTTCSDGAAQISEANSSLLCFVDHIIPLSEVLPHILTTSNDSALGSLQHICENGSAGHQDYSLSIHSATNDDTVNAKRVIETCQSAVDKFTQYTDHQYNAALRSDNLLQAAFLPSTGSAAAFHLGVGNNGAGTRGSKAREGKRQKQRLTLSASAKGPRSEDNIQRYSASHSTHSRTPTNNHSSSNNSNSTPSGRHRGTGTNFHVKSDKSVNSRDTTGNTENNNTTIRSNSAALLASIAAEVHAQQLRRTENCSYHEQFDAILDFKESDAALLSSDLQQMMVQAAHLARQNDPAVCIEGAVNSTNDADTAATMWNIYSSLRDSTV